MSAATSMVELPELTRLREVARDPRATALELAARGRRVVGHLCPMLPDELVHAAGMVPVRVGIRPIPPTRAGDVLQSFSCTWVQALVDQALRGELAHLDALVFPCNTCDSVQNLPDIWRRRVAAPAADSLAVVRFPVLHRGRAPEELLEGELAELRRWLEQRTGRPIGAGDLQRSARLFNQLRHALRRLHEQASAGKIQYSVVRAAALAAQSLDRDEALRLVRATADAVDCAAAAATPERTRVLLVGGPLDQPRLVDWLEARQVRIVEDDTCAVSNTFARAVDLDESDPLADMARRHARRPACPVQVESAARRLPRLLRSIRRYDADGVVFVPYKGCEPHAFDNVLLSRALHDVGVPTIEVEVDPHLGGWAQVVTRLEAFIEMLTGREIPGEVDELHDLYDPPEGQCR